jgi:hypothetical protein
LHLRESVSEDYGLSCWGGAEAAAEIVVEEIVVEEIVVEEIVVEELAAAVLGRRSRAPVRSS